MEWVEHNKEINASELNAKKKECEGILKPLMTKMYAVQETKATGNKKKAGGRRR